MTDRLTRLEQKKAKIEAEIAREKSRQKTKERKDDTRRKILTGAIALAHAERDAEFHRLLYGLLDRFIEPDRDRALLGLASKASPALPEPANDRARVAPYPGRTPGEGGEVAGAFSQAKAASLGVGT